MKLVDGVWRYLHERAFGLACLELLAGSLRLGQPIRQFGEALRRFPGVQCRLETIEEIAGFALLDLRCFCGRCGLFDRLGRAPALAYGFASPLLGLAEPVA